jgi:hypothetical protein
MANIKPSKYLVKQTSSEPRMRLTIVDIQKWRNYTPEYDYLTDLAHGAKHFGDSIEGRN